MKKITPLSIEDRQNISAMSRNRALSSYPVLKHFRGVIALAYKHYLATPGCAPSWHPVFPASLREAMKAHYRSECAPLEFIAYIRDKLSPGVCPVCGSSCAATVDHYLPKSSWPAYAFFSPNLIPACDQCNRKKGDIYCGSAPDERTIHPYFDVFLNQRLAIVKLTPPYSTPILEIVPHPSLTNATLTTVKWHLENVVRKTSICATLGERWANMAREPMIILEGLQYGATTQDALTRKLSSLDSSYGTPNNWESMLIAGILNEPLAIQYLEMVVADGGLQENPV
ncbi:MAG: HNH endonuclease [Acidobacteriaceae bacterium]